MTPTPTRSLEQRLAALEEANRIRSARAELKQRIRTDRTYRLLGWVIYNDTATLGLEEGDLDTAKVFELLLMAPKFGRVKVNRLFAQCRLSPSKTVGGLSDRQREELVVALGLVRRRLVAAENPYQREEALSR